MTKENNKEKVKGFLQFKRRFKEEFKSNYPFVLNIYLRKPFISNKRTLRGNNIVNAWKEKAFFFKTFWFQGLRNYIKYLFHVFFWENIRGYKLYKLEINDEVKAQQFRADEKFKRRKVKIKKLKLRRDV